jgi:5-methylcytosine-specific restriction endonuclease McrA
VTAGRAAPAAVSDPATTTSSTRRTSPSEATATALCCSSVAWRIPPRDSGHRCPCNRPPARRRSLPTTRSLTSYSTRPSLPTTTRCSWSPLSPAGPT